jgi:hypothetical protein
MAKIKIKFDQDAEIEDLQEPKLEIKLNIRRSLNGDYIVRDHPLIDIILMPQKNKILALSKDSMGDRTYYAQNKLFDFLYKKGIIDPASIQGGNVYSSMEATMHTPTAEGVSALQSALLMVTEFIEHEMPIFAYEEQLDSRFEQEITQPDPTNSTELGDVEQKERKGVLGQSIHTPQNAYNYSYFGE